MAKLKTREELKNDGITLWNGRCMKLIDQSEDMGLRLMDEGKDTESLVGMDLAIDLLLAEQRIEQLKAALRFIDKRCALYGPADAAREMIRTALAK